MRGRSVSPSIAPAMSGTPISPASSANFPRGRRGDSAGGRTDTRLATVSETLFFVLSSFWAGAVHAATPGHGKTIAAAYIVGARGQPVDAVILGVFVTLSHTFGIVGVAVLASLGAAGSVPARIEAYLAIVTGLLEIGRASCRERGEIWV